jgi:hypothetical protein
MIPVAVVLAAIVSVAPPAPDDAARDRYARYADDIAYAADDIETGLALVATAAIESHFRAKIERCQCERWECDAGKAFGLYQLHAHWLDGHSRFEVCRNNRLSTQLAARTIGLLRLRVGGQMERVFARFVGAPIDDHRVKARAAIFDELIGAYGVPKS